MLKKLLYIGLVLAICSGAVLAVQSLNTRKAEARAEKFRSMYSDQIQQYIARINEQIASGSRVEPDFSWLNGSNSAETAVHQRQRLQGDMASLAAGDEPLYPDILYGPNWRDEVEKFKNDLAVAEIQRSVAMIALAAGASMLALAALLFAIGAIKGVCVHAANEKQNAAVADGIRNEIQVIFDNFAGNIEDRQRHFLEDFSHASPTMPLNVEAVNASVQDSLAEIKKGLHSSLEELAAGIESALTEADKRNRQTLDSILQNTSSLARFTGGSADLPARLSAAITKAIGEFSAPITEKLEQINVSTRENSDSTISVIEKLLSENSDRLVASLSEVDSMGELANELADKLSGRMHGAIPAEEAQQAQALVAKVDANVQGLCEQIYAIREYAAQQQRRLTRLQDGYDWTIIRNFCLRIIRCVDNLDDRIEQLASDGRDASALKLLREELLFSLESSGVEQYTVEPGSDFRGQESRIKAMSEREVTDDPDLLGKIARVIRPGYQCFIDENSTRTVRPAEARVFGETSIEEIVIGGAK